MSEGVALTPGSARSLLQTILGEMVWPTGTPVWTSTLVHVLGGLGIEEQTARQAIARAGAQGWIEPQRHGREVQWSLAPRLASIFDTGSRRVLSLSDPFPDWDGSWLALLVTIPASRRQARRPLYAGLTWAGLGNPVPGLWLSPHVERREEVRRLVEELELSAHTLAMVGAVDAIGVDERTIVRQGWDLDGLAAHYEQMLKAIADLDPAPGDETLFAFLRMVSEWQELPRTDPQLPETLLPDWIGRRVAGRIEELRKQWTPEVRRRFAELNAGGSSSPSLR
jgi:phenylacetic acid degradation operon negative regulatory protein